VPRAQQPHNAHHPLMQLGRHPASAKKAPMSADTAAATGNDAQCYSTSRYKMPTTRSCSLDGTLRETYAVK
jgi:hypothetical protein